MEDKENELMAIFRDRNTRQMKSRELQNEAIKRGIREATFYRLLKRLTEKGILQKQVISKKNIQYILNQEALPKDISDVSRLQELILTKINEKLGKVEQVYDEVECFKQLTYWLGALTLYSAYETVVEGRLEFMEVPAFFVKYIGGAQAYVRRAINDRIMRKIREETPLTSDEEIVLIRELQNPKVNLEKLGAKYKLKPEYITQATERIMRVFTDLDKKVFEHTSYNGDKIETIKKLFEEVKSGRSMTEEARWLIGQIRLQPSVETTKQLKQQLMDLVKQFPEISRDKELTEQIKTALKE